MSIGDVLTLLRQEFPDVTISKIRFLESQGLVNPERTPSGYRKFYEHDVERLRWVLRQQREHFLPLKVIKDRLDEDGATDAGRTPASASAVVDGQQDASAPSVADDATILVGHGTAATDQPVASGSGLPGLGSPARRRAPARIGAAAASKPGAPAASTTPPVERAHRANMATPATQDPPTTHAADTPGAHGVANGTATSGRSGPTGASAPSASRAAPAHAPAAAAATTDGGGRGGKGSRTPAPAATPAGPSLSVEDLCAASGLRPEDIAELQAFGLLSATIAAGVEFFDEEALAVADLAAKFAGFGVEARHLRLYKNAADREAGFIEQIVIPMVRQRNPEARARAAQTAEELSDLGRQLKASLLRTSLRDIL
jgi:DNA-binding transcriptional MerR regulator